MSTSFQGRHGAAYEMSSQHLDVVREEKYMCICLPDAVDRGGNNMERKTD